MNRVYYKCTFLSDVVLNSLSATEGMAQTLDYIPGSNFLGIVARNYSKLGDKAYEIFHSGNFVFSDAHLMVKGKRSHKKPTNWYYKKTDVEQQGIELSQNIDWNMKFNEGIQMKQVRTGFFVEDIEDKYKSVQIERGFSIKSGYNREERRSDDGIMFGYEAIPKGTEWCFYLQGEKELLKEVGNYLEGEKGIGRSKNSQYGSVRIEKIENYDEDRAEKNLDNKELYIYFDSLAMFIDEFQQPTYEIKPEHLGLSSKSKIVWEKSQLRFKNYAPWNGIRQNRDYDRVCIDKGSVLVIDIEKEDDLAGFIKEYKNGVGVYKSEGKGQILVNPKFVVKNGVKLDNDQLFFVQPTGAIAKGKEDDLLLKILENDSKQQENQATVLKFVTQFADRKSKDWNNIKASQWGQIRNIATGCSSFNELHQKLFCKENEREGYLMKGKARDQWEGKVHKLEKAITSFNNELDGEYAIQCVIKIASEMGKKASKEQGGR